MPIEHDDQRAAGMEALVAKLLGRMEWKTAPNRRVFTSLAISHIRNNVDSERPTAGAD